MEPAPRLRRHRVVTERGPVLLACVLVATIASACTAGDESASCAALVKVDGHSYYGHSGPERPVPTTGEMVDATLPGCNDSGGPEEPAVAVTAQVIDGVPVETAVLHDGVVHIRDGARMPASSTAWFDGTFCTGTDTFRLLGRWRGATEPGAPYFDGTLEPPYDVMVDVEGPPGRLVGERVDVQVTTETTPVLTDEDLDRMPGATVRATVRCEDGAFVAVAITAE